MPKPPEHLNIAQIITTFGVKGEMKVRPESDDPLRLRELKEITAVLPSGEKLILKPETVVARKDGLLLVKFAGYDSPEAAAVLRQAWLQIPREMAKRQPGKVLYGDVLGLAVIDDTSGERLGTVQEVLRAAQDLLEIKLEDGREVLLPWVEAFVKRVDLEAGEVRVTVLEGLFD